MNKEEDTKKLRKIMEHLLVGRKFKAQKISWEQLKEDKMKEVDFVTEYWDWAKQKGYKAEETENRDLLNRFYHTEFHKKHPDYEVNGLEYFQALGKV